MNTNAKHTPGPWCATCEGYIAATEGGYIPIRTPFRKDAFDDGPNRSDHKEETLQANAAHIAACVKACEGIDPAAVPAMLEALRELIGIVDYAITEKSTDSLDSFTLQPARAAILRAEGGAQ